MCLLYTYNLLSQLTPLVYLQVITLLKLKRNIIKAHRVYRKSSAKFWLPFNARHALKDKFCPGHRPPEYLSPKRRTLCITNPLKDSNFPNLHTVLAKRNL